MKKTMFNFDSKQEVREAFKAGNRARKKESVQDTIESVDSIQAQIDRFEKQTGIELEIRDGHPYFDGDLDLEDCTKLTSLPAYLEVNGDLDLAGCTGLTSLPVNLKVRGSLFLLEYTGLTSLPDDLKVGKDLELKYCTGLTSLPDDLEVYGKLNLAGCTGLTSLPDGLKVRGELYLYGCTGLTSLPDGLKVGGLYLSNNTELTSLPDDLEIEGCLDIGCRTGLTSLPPGLKVGGDLDLRGCTGLISLPPGLKVGGDLYLSNNTGLTSLPFDLVIQGNWIIHKGVLKSFFRKLRIPVSRDGYTKAKDWRNWQKAHGYLTEAFKAGNRARKKESVQDAIESVDSIQAQIDRFEKQTGIKLEIMDGYPYYDGDLYLDDCTEPTSLSSLPNGLKVEGDLWLTGFTGLTGLPAGLEVGGDLDLTGCTGLTSLPDGLKVEGCLWLTGCTGLTNLPDGLKVGRDLFLKGCTGLTGLPSDLVVQGEWIVHNGLLIPFFNKLGIPIDIDRDTRALYWRDWQKAHGYLTEAFRAGNCARKKESMQDTVDSIDDIRAQIDLFKKQTGVQLEIRDGKPFCDHCLQIIHGAQELTSLPDGLTIDGSLFLRNCNKMTSLPSDLTIYGNYIRDIPDSLLPFFEELGVKVHTVYRGPGSDSREKTHTVRVKDWMNRRHLIDRMNEAFRAGNKARKKEAVQDSQTDNVDTIDNLEDLLDVCDKVVRLYSGREHQFPKGWVFGTDGSGINPPEITESPINDRQYLRNWLVKYRYDFNGSRIRSDLAKELPGDENYKFDSDWDLIHSNGRATHLNFDYTVGVMKKKDEDGYRIIFNDGVNESCVYMPGYSRSFFGMALMHLFSVTFMKRYIKAAYYQGVNDPLGDENYKEAEQMIINLFTKDVPMSIWKPEQVTYIEIGQELVYMNSDLAVI